MILQSCVAEAIDELFKIPHKEASGSDFKIKIYAMGVHRQAASIMLNEEITHQHWCIVNNKKTFLRCHSEATRESNDVVSEHFVMLRINKVAG